MPNMPNMIEMRSRTNIFVAYTLTGLFTLFNVGLPVVLFVCPMMSGGQVCECNMVQHGGLTISYPMGGCCSHAVVAERNTIPFLSSEKYQSPTSEIVFVLSSVELPSIDPAQTVQFANSSNTGPPHAAAPLYLLSSSLLI
jgi:hypothetical protein